MSSIRVFLSTLACAGVIAACSPAQSKGVQLYYFSLQDMTNATFDHPVVVARTISYRGELADAAVRELLKGPSKDESRRLNARMSDDLRALAPLLIGVTVEGDTATVNFKKEALTILNSAAARQMMAKQPIEQTLLHLTGVTKVQYSVDSKIFTEWDA